MALLRLAAAWPGRPRISILTVDHGLRAESAAEAAQVATWSASAGLSHVTLRWEGEKPRTGLQAKAREARYDLMARWCQENGAAWLLTAHTMDDQAETVIMRMARTTSLDSLAGIPVHGQWKGARLFRPLLGQRRDALRAMLRQQGQAWIEDPSNEDERFERVRIRKALPVLAELGITVMGLNGFAAEVRAAADALWGATAEWVEHHVRVFDEGYCAVPLAAYGAQAAALKTRILGRLISRFGAGVVPEPGELTHLAHWVDGGGSRRTLGGAIIARRKDHLIIGREPGRIATAPVVVPETGRLVWDGRFEVMTVAGSLVQPVGAAGAIPRNRGLPAFVQQSLPAIILPTGSRCVPHLGLGQGAGATFCASAGR